MTDQWIEFAEEIKKMYGKDIVPLHEPSFDETEIKYVTDCVQSGWVSSVGSYVDRFERDLADYTGVKRAVAVVNGTAALHIALKIAGVQANEEVFMPSLTFIATANAVSYLQAVPHFVDVSERTLGLDPEKLEDHIREIGEVKDRQLFNKQTGRLIRAVLPMHTFGHPVDLDPLLEVCEKYHLVLVEDAAESLGSFYKGKHTGGFGKTAAISFNGNKIITTGGGGAILADDDKLADYAKHLTTTAKVPHKWEYVHDEIGYNYRMPNLNAALGCAQLGKINKFVRSKRSLVDEYQKFTKGNKKVKLYIECEYSRSNYWLHLLKVDQDQNQLGTILAALNNNGIMARPVWRPLHKIKSYATNPRGDLTATLHLERTIVNLPSTSLSFKDV